jgi:ActR/RegA family two-component response regulator
MRSARDDTPVVVLATPTSPQVRVQVLDLGADDFITRPCDMGEVSVSAATGVDLTDPPIRSRGWPPFLRGPPASSTAAAGAVRSP